MARRSYAELRNLFYIYLFWFLAGAVMHEVFYDIQENFYTAQNWLFDFYNLAGMFQLSLTSMSAVFCFTNIGLLIYLTERRANRLAYSTVIRKQIIQIISIGWLVYSAREISQFFAPMYYDHNFIDIGMALIASLLLMIPPLLIKPQD